MANVTGRLLGDLHPNGTVRIVFIATDGGGNEAPLTAKNLDAAEIIFMTCGLTKEDAAALRLELEQNKVCNLEASVDNAVAANFRYVNRRTNPGFGDSRLCHYSLNDRKISASCN